MLFVYDTFNVKLVIGNFLSYSFPARLARLCCPADGLVLSPAACR